MSIQRTLKRLILKADMRKKGYRHVNKNIKKHWKEAMTKDLHTMAIQRID